MLKSLLSSCWFVVLAFVPVIGWSQAATSHQIDAQAASRHMTSDVYARAERLLFWNVVSLVPAGVPPRQQLIFNDQVIPNWIAGSDRFWYRLETPQGVEFIFVDPEHGIRRPAFDHQKLAAALSGASGKNYTANRLPFLAIQLDGTTVEFNVGPDHWQCQLATYDCNKKGKAERPSPAEVKSPDGRWAAFTKDYNLYLRELATGLEVELTKDGENYYDYASLPDSRQTAVSDRISGTPLTPQVVWSPDSRKLVTYRLDQRKVKELYLIQSVPPEGVRPLLYSYRYPMPGDTDVALAELMVFDVDGKNKVVLKHAPQIVDYIAPTQARWVWWGKDSSQIYFIEKDRGEKTIKLNVADEGTGVTRTIVEEHRSTFLEPSPLLGTPPLVRELNGGAEVIWYSERDGWAHLYLYDGKTGALKNQITSGHWVVRDLLYVDETKRWIYFAASGRERGEDPYLRHLYRIKLDGTGLQLLTPEDAEHLNEPLFVMDTAPPFSPSGRYFVDTYSRADLPPVTVLRSADGTLVRELERADVTALQATGWKPPERFQTKAADGTTDIYGLIYRPSKFDPHQKYAVIDSPYPGPQAIRTAKIFFTDPSNAPAMAELGFIVITVDGRGTPLRSKAFHDYTFGHMGKAGLEDHIAAIRELAARYPYMDLGRVGIYGHSAGGFASARALLMYPDFYHVGVASAGGYDQRGYIANWGEKYEGLVEGDNYLEQVTSRLAMNLKGKLLLAYGDLDDNVSPALALQLVDALIKANKDFELLVLPNRNHLANFDPYFIRREWDFMVRNLLHIEPPQGYEIEDPLKPKSN